MSLSDYVADYRAVSKCAAQGYAKVLIFIAIGVIAAVGLVEPGLAGSIFLTGHDPDFHGSLGPNTTGARNINQAAISYILDPVFNPFVASGASKFLLVESNVPLPAGHTRGKNGIIGSGYVEGVDFEHHDASTLNAELDLLGTKYGGIVVASDFGGTLTQAELDILIARKSDIIDFLNADGGLYGMAESNGGAGLTPGGGHFGYIPIVVSTVPANQSEGGFTVTPFGASLGIADADVNGNFSHNVFTDTGGLEVVDVDAQGRVISVAGRQQVVQIEETTWGQVKAMTR